ncbi:MAG: hypothetical protein HFE77_03635 [Clostridiales bacterium]|nr:hypothetical protein [Clostridiales bacterium]
MRKKLSCLCLCVALMLGVVLTGCGTNDENATSSSDGATQNQNATTVTIAMSKGEGTTDEAAQLVEDAINAITENKLNTHVELYLYEKSELKQAIMNRVGEISHLLENGEDLAANNVDKDAEDVVVVDKESGRKETQYPEVANTQFDIILINGIDDYYDYLNMSIYLDGANETGLLKPITPSSLIRQYVNATLLTTAQDKMLRDSGSGSVYAIPNNRDFGEYTYLVLNKSLCDRLGYNPDELTSREVEGTSSGFVASLNSLSNYLNDVHNSDPNMTLLANVPNIDTIFYTFDASIPVGRSQYFGAGQETSTLLEAPPNNLYGSDAYKAYYNVMTQLGSWGQRPTAQTADLSGDFAAAYVKGNATTIKDIDPNKYYVRVCDVPVKSNEYVYSSMFGVTKYSINAERAAAVIELFNTNARFRNLMYYGVENVHYTVEENGDYLKISNDWNMDLYDTGNLYLLERSVGLGDYYYALSENKWQAGKDLNRDSVTGLLLGFHYEADEAMRREIESLRTKAAQWNSEILNGSMTTAQVKDAMDADSSFMKIVDSEDEKSIYSQYRTWYATMVPEK